MAGKTDCFAYCGKATKACDVLKVPQCEGDKCKFYKTKEQYDADAKRAAEACGSPYRPGRKSA